MLNFTPTFRALTSGSPITTAIHQVRRMAQQYLERGGAVVSAEAGPAGFVLPSDVDATALAKAIEARLIVTKNAKPNRTSGLSNLLERKANGQLVVPQVVLERLGAGDASYGEQILKHLLNEIRG